MDDIAVMDGGVHKVLVIGGGIGGLCVAIALRMSGINVSVYEQVSTLGRAGAGLTLWPNAIRALRKLGVAEQILKSGSRIERAEIRTASGHTLKVSHSGQLEEQYGEPTIAIHRAELHRALLSALPADIIHLGEKCVHVEQNGKVVYAHFESGRVEKADLLIAADGIHSKIRSQLFPESKPRFAGYSSWRGVVAMKDVSTQGVAIESFGRGSRFGFLSIDKQHIYWYATANAAAGQNKTASGEKNFLRERFKGWHHPVEMLIDNTPADQILHTDIYDIKPMKKWSKGRVVLLGDAAHATTPNMGQGGCMAIESALALARCLKQESDASAALFNYERQRMPRTKWITEQSWKIGRFGQLENRWACTARDFLLKVAPESMLKRQIEQIASYDA